MKHFLVKIAVFIVVLFAADLLVSSVLRWYRPIDYRQFLDAKQTLFQSDSTYDVLIIGDSHVADAIDPRVLDSICGLTSFNLGIYHSTPFENYHALVAALEHMPKKPKTIILGTNPHMFIKKATPGQYTALIVNRLDTKWSLYRDSEMPVDASFFLRSVKERYLFSSVYRSLRGGKYKPTREVHAIYNGYLESRNQIRGTNWTDFKDHDGYVAPKDIQLDYFNRMIALARAQHIEVLIVNPPLWNPLLEAERKRADFKDFTASLGKFHDQYDVAVFNENFTVLDSALTQGDFLNTEHLNYFGAKKFSIELATWLKAKTAGVDTTSVAVNHSAH